MVSTDQTGRQALLRALGRLYAACVSVYAVGVMGMVAASLLLSETIPVVGILKSGLPLALLPVLVLLPLSLLLRRVRLVLLLVPVLLSFVLEYGPLFLPRTVAVPAQGIAFSLMTYNVKAPFGEEIPPIIDVIRAADADIVAMQEMSYDLAQDWMSH